MQIPAGRVRTTLPGQPTTSLQGKGTCIPRTLNSITFMLAPATAAQQLSKTVGVGRVCVRRNHTPACKCRNRTHHQPARWEPRPQICSPCLGASIFCKRPSQRTGRPPFICCMCSTAMGAVIDSSALLKVSSPRNTKRYRPASEHTYPDRR
jgi:hypothetical protein